VIEALSLAALIAAASPVESRYGLPPRLLVAVVLIESSGRAIVSRRRRCGGVDVGVGQVHVHEPTRARVRRLLVLSTNLDRAGYLLARSRRLCGDRCRCPEALYNWSGRTRWCSRLYARWRWLLRGGES
jgi:hypothetical protein